MAANKRSRAWKVFVLEKVDGRQKAVCKKCGVKLAFSGGTGNLLTRDVDLVLYCMDMTMPWFTSAESRAISLITNMFGPMMRAIGATAN